MLSLQEREKRRNRFSVRLRGIAQRVIARLMLRRRVEAPNLGSGPTTSVPTTLAIIMDGNGRWADNRRLTRSLGHAAGAKKAREVMKLARARGIQKLCFWAASVDNFLKRSPEEMAHLAQLMKENLRSFLNEPEEVRIRICGAWKLFIDDPELDALVDEVEKKTAVYQYLELTIFFGYGGENDILQMTRRSIRDFIGSGRPVEDIDAVVTAAYMRERLLSSWIDGEGLLIIRTGEESACIGHTSDFLMLQLRHAEWVFTQTLWPDFSAAELDRILNEYGSRCRPNGGAPRA